MFVLMSGGGPRIRSSTVTAPTAMWPCTKPVMESLRCPRGRGIVASARVRSEVREYAANCVRRERVHLKRQTRPDGRMWCVHCTSRKCGSAM